MLSLLKARLPIIGVVLIILGLLYTSHVVSKSIAVRRAVSETRQQMTAEYTKNLLEASEIAREREQSMVASADKIRKDKDAQIVLLNSRVGSLLSELRQRPQRPPSTPQGSSAPSPPKGATGAELYRDDAEVLVRIAGRADRLRAALDQCYRQYDAVRQSLN